MSSPGASCRLTWLPVLRSHRVVLAGAEVVLPLNSVVGVVGLNGAGKTTLFRCLADLLPEMNHARISALDPVEKLWTAPLVLLVPQQPAIPTWLTVAECVGLYGYTMQVIQREYGSFRFDRIANQSISTLSVGEAQLLAVCLVMLYQSEILMLDEPLSGLDMQRRREVLELVEERKAKTRNNLTLISSHIASDLFESCDYFLVLRSGGVVFAGDKPTVMAHASVNDANSFEKFMLTLMTAEAVRDYP